MRAETEILRNHVQTGRKIYTSANYYRDLGLHLDSGIEQFFDFVRSIPYTEDPDNAEILSRPKYLLDRERFPYLDCKKKAILMGAWLNAHNIPWQAIAISEKPDKTIHHVYVRALINGEWKNVDPTYMTYRLYQAKPQITYAEILPR